MHRSARDNPATQRLLQLAEDRATGRLSVGAGAVEVSVYLLGGEIMAATAADDDRQLVRVLAMREMLPDGRVDELEELIDQGQPVFGALLEATASAALDDVLFERFHQNLCEYVTSVSEPDFTEQKGVFVDNIQMGHDTATLIDEVCALSDRAHELDLEALLLRGAADPGGDPMAAAVAEELDPETPRTVSSLLHELPLEPTRARALLADLIASDVASVDGGGDDDDDDADVDLEELGPEALQSADLIEIDDLPEEPDSSELEVIEPVQQLPDAQPMAEEFDSAELEPTEAELVVGAHDPGEAITEDEIEDAPTQQVPRPALEDDTPMVDLEDDTPMVDPEQETEAEPTGESDPSRSWAGLVDDDELDFFSDHDYDRGGHEDGAFSTQSHNLDKVEVSHIDTDAHEVIEAAEAPTVKYGAPVLSDDEALAKLEVANGVLTAVVQAFDEAEGKGRGRAVVQLLVDGGPSKYAPLLQNLQVSPDGALPDDMVLRNLYNRPPTEHRQLLNGSLVDIIERALSSAADELPDEAFDTVLSAVSGYRQRLGL